MEILIVVKIKYNDEKTALNWMRISGKPKKKKKELHSLKSGYAWHSELEIEKSAMNTSIYLPSMIFKESQSFV